jgi:hypothetical protein
MALSLAATAVAALTLGLAAGLSGASIFDAAAMNRQCHSGGSASPATLSAKESHTQRLAHR